jgi:cytochrome b561
MLLGFVIKPLPVVLFGLAGLVLIAFQVLEGKRKIRFKGPLHMKVHRMSAYAVAVVSLIHAVLALVYLGII